MLTIGGLEIYVRECYSEFWDICSSVQSIIIAGTPGIGKSLFLKYALHRLIVEKPASEIVWCKPVDADAVTSMCTYVAMNMRGEVSRSGRNQIGDVITAFNQEDVWILNDGVAIPQMSAPFKFKCHVIMVASPKKARWSGFQKCFPQPSFHTMPVCLWEEIVCIKCGVSSFSSVPDGVAQRQFELWGGSLRRVLEVSSESYDERKEHESFERALNVCEPKLFLHYSYETADAPEVAHMLLHYHSESPFIVSSLRFASSYVAERITEKYGDEVVCHLKNFVTTCNNMTEFSASCGWLLEPLAYKAMSMGGTFLCRDLEVDKDPFDIELTACSPHRFFSLGELNVEPGKMYVPEKKNLGAVDYLAKRGGVAVGGRSQNELGQVTFSVKCHGYKSAELKKACAKFRGEPFALDIITLKKYVHGAKKQRFLTRGGSGEPQWKDLTTLGVLSGAHQYVIGIDLTCVVCVVYVCF